MADVKLKPIKESITKEDILKTQSKFNAWDKFIAGNIDQKYELALLKDPTIFSYAFLKDKENNPLKLRPYQDLMINDRCQHIICALANQIGKSWTGIVKTIHHALFVPNATALMISKTETQSKTMLRELKQMCARSDIELADDTDNKTLVTIKNHDDKGSSQILALPPTEAALSYPATLEVLDEAAFMVNGIHLYNQVFETRVGDTQHWNHKFLTIGQIFIISNPNSTQGLMWNKWNDSRFSRYRFDWAIHPHHTKAMMMEKIKLGQVNQDEFDSCYAAIFTSSMGRFIKTEWFDAAIDRYFLTLPKKSMVYFGLDLTGEDVKSRNVDRTVLYGVMVQSGEFIDQPVVKVVYRHSWPPGTKRKIIYNEIKRLSQWCNFGGLAYDKMGVGDTVRHSLTDPQGPYKLPPYLVHPLTYSLPNKSDVYQNFRNLYEFRRIIHPEIPELRKQMATLDFEKTEAGYLKVQHYKQSLKDDEPDALANACYLAIRLASSRASISFISTKKKY